MTSTAEDPQAARPWADASLPPDERARLLEAALTEDERHRLLHSHWAAGRMPGATPPPNSPPAPDTPRRSSGSACRRCARPTQASG